MSASVKARLVMDRPRDRQLIMRARPSTRFKTNEMHGGGEVRLC